MAKLNVSNVKNAKCELRPLKLTDGGGLYLYVNKSGKYWRYDYRFLNKRKTLSIGTFPEDASGNEVNTDFPFGKIGKSAPPRGCTSFQNPNLNGIPEQSLDNRVS